MQNKKPELKTLKLNDAKVIDSLKFDDSGLLPVIIQDAENQEVLMLAYTNKESLQKTIETGLATYWSRSRKCFWVKGETSGHYQKVREIYFDCDKDTLLFKIEQIGVACHTGARTCFVSKMA